MSEEKRSRTVTGQVVSNKMDKTIVVTMNRTIKHPRIKKIIKRTSKMHAHDAKNECQIGDLVQIKECKPISKNKTWELVSILERAVAE